MAHRPQVTIRTDPESMERLSSELAQAGSTLIQAFAGMAQSCVAAGAAITAGTAVGIALRSALEAVAEQERSTARAGRETRRGPNGGIILPLFGGVELPPFVREVRLDSPFHRGMRETEVGLYSRAGFGLAFLVADEVLHGYYHAGRAGREQARRRFLVQLNNALRQLEQAEQERPETDFAADYRGSFQDVPYDGQIEDDMRRWRRPLAACAMSCEPWSTSSCPSPENEQAHRLSKQALRENLSPVQRKEFDEFGKFTLQVSSGERYRIEAHQSFNVRRITEGGGVLDAYCAAPADGPPIYDQMLAQKFWLETDEVGFLAAANKCGVITSGCVVPI